ncbi:MAG: ABC transporter ATP-binding protein [Actinomycetota bacterium]|nr:ABC transporter ATP-binding protein [Actinomycetota bacterium]
MGLKTFGTMAVDWEERVDFERLRTQRLARAKQKLAESDVGALLCFDMANIRYITATHIGTWAMDKLIRFCLLPQGGEPIMWDFGSAARHHKLYNPWLGDERSRAGISTLRGAVEGRAESVAEKIRVELEERGLLGEPVGVDVVELPVLRALEAEGITVRFGGLVAVDNVSLEVRAGEIVGLIGPNGAGKTTLFNAVSGLNRPTSGSVLINGADASAKKVHERATLGLARTFQVIQLFPQLDVFDNILIGTHLHSRGDLWSRLVLTRGAVEAEVEAVERVDEVVRWFGLSHIRHSAVSSLPFGTLRMVELARAVVTGAPVIMLDEPASGLDNAETDRLSDFLRRLRVEFGLSILVIEHDVRMVTALTDYMYVIDRGTLIAEGTPSEIQANEAVIAAYLGGGTARTPAAS